MVKNYKMNLINFYNLFYRHLNFNLKLSIFLKFKDIKIY